MLFLNAPPSPSPAEVLNFVLMSPSYFFNVFLVPDVWMFHTINIETLKFMLYLFEHHVLCAQVAQSWQTLCDPMDRRLPGSSVHGILQARILDWIAMPSSRGSSCFRDWTCVSYVYKLNYIAVIVASFSYEHDFEIHISCKENFTKQFLFFTKNDILWLFFFLAVPCGLQGLSSPTRDWTWALAVEAPSSNHWTTREFLVWLFCFILYFIF